MTVLEMLVGAMDELVIGNPSHFETDVGPVITAAAADGLNRHIERMRHEARIIKACGLDESHVHGSYRRAAPHRTHQRGATDPRGVRSRPARRSISIRRHSAGSRMRSARAIMA